MPKLIAESRINGRCQHFQLMDGTKTVSYAAALDLLQESIEFRNLLTQALTSSPYQAFRWETPPITVNTVDRPFEFVVVDSPELERQPDVTTFQAHFNSSLVVSFRNLGGDAMMVVPCPHSAPAAYTHLAAFMRQAPAHQIHTLWQRVGQAVSQHLSSRPLWLSTAGGGVAWLHVRLDSRSKYYSYTPYKSR